MRRRYRQDPITNELYEVFSDQAPAPKVFVRGDYADFVSPVDRTVVHGRKSLREHNARNGVVNTAEFGDSFFERKKAERESFYKGESEKHKREIREDIRRTIDQKEKR